MRTVARRTHLHRRPAPPPAWLDASGVPLVGELSRSTPTVEPGGPLAGLPTGTLLVRVAGVAAEDVAGTLLWGSADDRSILFVTDPATADELLEALDADEEPVAVVEPRQVILQQLG
jgi:hypothetical protein